MEATVNKITLPTIYTLHKYAPVDGVFVIGCGGTGAYTISYLARYISALPKRNIKLILADGDKVEEKNLKRQHFISSDIGRNKAEVLAERYSGAFGIEIIVMPEDIENVKKFDVLNKMGLASQLVIGCVDNNASRKIIYDWFINADNKYIDKFWIDSGNEEISGQVICGYTPNQGSYYDLVKVGGKAKGYYAGKPAVDNVGLFSLPCAMEVYPELMKLEDKFNSKLSCAERAISAPQNIQTNITASTIIMNFAQKVINGDPLKSFGVEFSINNAFTTKHNTLENLSVVNKDRKAYWER